MKALQVAQILAWPAGNSGTAAIILHSLHSGLRLLSMDNSDIDMLEIKVSYLEDTVSKLNDVIIDQERTIGSLIMRIESLEKKVEDLIEVTGEARPNRKPPHY